MRTGENAVNLRRNDAKKGREALSSYQVICFFFAANGPAVIDSLY